MSKPLQVQMKTPSTAQLACKTMRLGPSHSPTPCMPTCIKQPTRPFPPFLFGMHVFFITPASSATRKTIKEPTQQLSSLPLIPLVCPLAMPYGLHRRMPNHVLSLLQTFQPHLHACLHVHSPATPLPLAFLPSLFYHAQTFFTPHLPKHHIKPICLHLPSPSLETDRRWPFKRAKRQAKIRLKEPDESPAKRDI